MEGLASESITKNDYFQNGMTQMFFPPGLAKNEDSGTALIQIPNIHVPNPVHKKISLSLSIRIFTIFGYELCYVQDLNQRASYWGQPNIYQLSLAHQSLAYHLGLSLAFAQINDGQNNLTCHQCIKSWLLHYSSLSLLH